MARDEIIQVEVVYAQPDLQKLIPLQVMRGATAADAIARSGLASYFPDVDLLGCAVAIWGKTASPERVLEPGDRVEILRPLGMDPREARRKLAAMGRVMSRVTGDGD